MAAFFNTFLGHVLAGFLFASTLLLAGWLFGKDAAVTFGLCMGFGGILYASKRIFFP